MNKPVSFSALQRVGESFATISGAARHVVSFHPAAYATESGFRPVIRVGLNNGRFRMRGNKASNYCFLERGDAIDFARLSAESILPGLVADYPGYSFRV